MHELTSVLVIGINWSTHQSRQEMQCGNIIIIIDSMTSVVNSEEKPQQLPISEKYGLKYYSYILSQSVMLFLFIRVGDPYMCMAFAGFYNIVGSYLPIKAGEQRQWSKMQNNNKFLLGPLIASCISTPVIIYILWINYDQIVLATCHSTLQLIALIFSMGLVLSGSIDASHQLLHRTQPVCKFFSYLNLVFFQFTIYPTEHLYLHHKKVGTPEDPITSPKNKSVYAYFFNALFSCYKFNYRYSKKIFAMNVASTCLYNLVLVWLSLREGSGLSKAIFFSMLSYTVLFIMESTQYIEHYGLIYRKDEKSQPVGEICSWNTTQNEYLNWLVFRFQRHSDHHMNAYKIYPTLDLSDKMPQFPFDFVSGMVMATCPPLWSRLINPLVDEVIENKPAGKQHHKLVSNCFTVLRVALLLNFAVKAICYFVM